MRPTLAKNIDTSKLTFGNVIPGKQGGKVLFPKYGDSSLCVQLPKMMIPFSASDYQGNNKFSINFSFDNDNDQHMQVLKNLKDLDKKIIEEASSNSLEWFGKKRSVEFVEENFQSQLKFPSEEKYSTRLKASIPLSRDRNSFECTVVDMSGDKVSLTTDNITNEITSKSVGTAILECVGIWIVQNSLTLKWKLVKMKYSKFQSKQDLEFEDDTDDEVDEDDDVRDTSSESSVELDEVEEVEEPKKRTGGKRKTSLSAEVNK
jgi:hypothetical protein